MIADGMERDRMASEATKADDLPELTFDLAREIGSFPEFEYELDREQLAEYRKLVAGDAEPGSVVPPGFAAVFGRLGYLREHRMPPGGVLLGQDIRWLAEASVDQPLVIGSQVMKAEEHDGKRTIVFVTTARQAGTIVAQVRITARWPK
jgi:hypothetical protein